MATQSTTINPGFEVRVGVLGSRDNIKTYYSPVTLETVLRDSGNFDNLNGKVVLVCNKTFDGPAKNFSMTINEPTTVIIVKDDYSGQKHTIILDRVLYRVIRHDENGYRRFTVTKIKKL